MGIDYSAVMSRIHDLIIKTFISIEAQVIAAIDMFVPHRALVDTRVGFDTAHFSCWKVCRW
jgi:hypothetical protein